MRERLFSADRAVHSPDRNFLSNDDMRQCEETHLSLIEKLQTRVKDAKLARFTGFVSPTKLHQKLIDTSEYIRKRSRVMSHNQKLSTVVTTSGNLFPNSSNSHFENSKRTSGSSESYGDQGNVTAEPKRGSTFFHIRNNL